MLFRQLFDAASSTYRYVLASGVGREAVIIDPVREQLAQYLTVISDLDLKLVTAIDTHTHADHITALGGLRESTGCVTVMGEHTRAECVSYRVADGEVLKADGIELRAMFTPGHTNESFSFVLQGDAAPAVFTGDVLLIRGSGRTDFQGGDAHASWDSIVTDYLSCHRIRPFIQRTITRAGPPRVSVRSNGTIRVWPIRPKLNTSPSCSRSICPIQR